jgi:hypothetical protein
VRACVAYRVRERSGWYLVLLVAMPVSVSSMQRDVFVSGSRFSFYNLLTRHRLVEHELFSADERGEWPSSHIFHTSG